MKHEILTIRQMCDRFDITARALRFYEAKELLSPIRVGNRRRYTYADQVRVKLILQGKRFGFLLEEIRTLLNLYSKEDQQYAQLTEAYRLAEIHRAEMISRRDELVTAITELTGEMRSVAVRLNHMNSGGDQTVRVSA